jgi:hypothetical protein
MPAGLTLGYIVYLLITYLLVQCSFPALLLSFIFHAVLFVIYCSVYHKSWHKSWRALLSSWTMFAYLIMTAIFGYITDNHLLDETTIIIALIVLSSFNYYLLINQKNYNKE